MFKSAQYLHQQILNKRSCLCVGLDPDITKMPENYRKSDRPLFDFCLDIIECTESFAVAYKLNVAFFEAHGPQGWMQFEDLVAKIPSELFVIADAKRADIGNTSAQYAEYYFNRLKVDAITLHPYMGRDSIEPFLNYKEHWSIVLALTSNPGSQDFELQVLDNGLTLYEKVITDFVQHPNSERIMFVCGATHPEEFRKIRKSCPDSFLLIPGVGEQGGDLDKILELGQNEQVGLLINVSRKISYPSSHSDFKGAVRAAAEKYQQSMSLKLR